ncbi:hypothetical protein DH2020_014042 [Rehmannia glutinosa]|uniref:Peptidase C14 caspase domain-containing protein n=1 Tax=Rehmannia glutinosa TaxID=99300 RepID=A0ABR0WYD1_REHGL
MALLVGCTYSGYPGELYGCHNDVLGMRELLIARFGFKLIPTRMIPFKSILQYFTTLTGKTSTDIGTHLVEVFGDDASIMFRPHDPINKTLEADEGILLSGCQKNESSYELTEKDVSKPCGAFTYAVQMVFKENPAGRNLSNREVVIKARKFLKLMPDDIENEQHPCLYCKDEIGPGK